MSKPQVINTLEDKRLQLVDRIDWLEKELKQARADLSHVVAVKRLYEAPEAGAEFPTHMNLNRLFKRGELPTMLCNALEVAPDGLDTRQLALAVIADKGLDTNDRHLRSSIAYRIVQVMRRMERQGRIKRLGKRENALVWRLV